MFVFFISEFISKSLEIPWKFRLPENEISSLSREILEPIIKSFLNQNIVSQAFAGKCILRAVLHEIIPKHKGVFYFPSFEYVLTDNPNSYISDNMHVKRYKVAQILKSLENATF